MSLDLIINNQIQEKMDDFRKLRQMSKMPQKAGLRSIVQSAVAGRASGTLEDTSKSQNSWLKYWKKVYDILVTESPKSGYRHHVIYGRICCWIHIFFHITSTV